MKLTDIGYIRSLMEEHGLSFQKKFGQNFLINETVAPRLASYASKNVIEIGPGVGTVTRELAARSERVLAVEIDRGLIPILKVTVGDCPNVKVINADIMKCDISALICEYFAGEEASVCANLPFNITTPVIMRLLETSPPFGSIAVMLQKEACDRFCAAPGSPAYGAVTAAVSYYAKTERLFRVSPGSYMPRPKVESEVMRFLPYKTPPVDVSDRALLLRLIRAAFASRRKTIKNALRAGFSVGGAEADDIISAAGLAPDIRGECLSLPEFARLCEELFIILKRGR